MSNFVTMVTRFVSESGIGAGIDSYYEYMLKAYVLLGDKTYLNRFNKVLLIKHHPQIHIKQEPYCVMMA